jgi:hypothetical protein
VSPVRGDVPVPAVEVPVALVVETFPVPAVEVPVPLVVETFPVPAVEEVALRPSRDL